MHHQKSILCADRTLLNGVHSMCRIFSATDKIYDMWQVDVIISRSGPPPHSALALMCPWVFSGRPQLCYYGNWVSFIVAMAVRLYASPCNRYA